MISKLHMLAAHTIDTVNVFGCLGSLAEQLFENYQAISLKQRETHSPNQCTGVQIT